MPSPKRLAFALLLLVLGGVLAVETLTPRNSLVVYCAHDAEYAEPLLREFERRTGIPLDIRFDTEATKSLGLVELIMQEANHPRADVFWNNQLMGTLDLKDAHLLAPYRGSGYQRIPATFKDPEGTWTGFAARFRVYIVNSSRIPHASPGELWQLTNESPTQVAIAKPLFGTTRSHYTALWHTWGPDRLKAWHLRLHRDGVVEATGNAMVKDLVAAGTCQAGWTDSDDFFAAQLRGSPVAMVPWRLDDVGTICIPNTVAIIRGTRHRGPAEQLVDYLLSEETEVALAHSPSRQVPLGLVAEDQLPAEVRNMLPWVEDSVVLRDVGPSRQDCLLWLKSLYVP